LKELLREAEYFQIHSLVELLAPKDIQFSPGCDGVIFWIGTNGETKKWENPAISGNIKIFTNIERRSIDSIFKLVDRRVNGEASGSECSVGAGSWVSIDLGSITYVCPHSYKLKAPPCDLGDYNFEGSVDGTEWKKLHANKRIAYDMEKWKTGQDYIFLCPTTDIYYRWFRWVSTKGNCFHLSGFELFGKMKVKQELF